MSGAAVAFDVAKVRADFPVLRRRVRGKPLAYLDNAASAQKPQAVLDAVARYYGEYASNVHRGVHALSEQATLEYEGARDKVRAFLGAADRREVVFVRGTTEAINLVARSFVRPRLKEGDEVLVTHMEHHSNIVPWQLVCREAGAKLRAAPIDDAGDVVLDEFERMLTPRTRFASVVHVSNALGTVNPVREIVALAKERGVPVLLDGAQAIPHGRVNVAELGCDFYAFSGHKFFGPTGIGVLWGRGGLLEAMPPYQGGGDMIKSVRFEGTTWNDLPYKFEAGTPHVAGAIGLGAAVDYVSALDAEAVRAHERELLDRAVAVLRGVEGVRLVGTPRERAGAVSFVLDGVHPHDVGTVLDQEGVAVRTGHHCAQPVMERFSVPATVRASVAFYNTTAEIDALAKGLRRARDLFRG
jgi:cysteine desulfurase/selenocysteine lyase